MNDNNAKMSSLQFSEAVIDALGEKLEVLIDISTARKLYQEIISKLDRNDRFGSGFIGRGLSLMNKIETDGQKAFKMSAYAAHQLSSLAYKTNSNSGWVPKVVKRRGEGSEHTDKYLFIWSTVKEEWMEPRVREWISDNIERFEVKDSTPEVFNDEQVYLARKYVSLSVSAQKRGVDFTITLRDLEELLKDKHCYFTGVELVHFQHDVSTVSNGDMELPDNYLTIDRLDSDKGYIPGNVVLASHKANQLKDRMNTEDFKKAIEVKKQLEEKGLTKDQLRLLCELS